MRLVAADAAGRAGLDYDEVEDFRIAVDELCHLLMSSTDHEISVSFGVVGRCVLARGRAQRRPGIPLVAAQRPVAHDHRLGHRPPRAHRPRRRARVRGDEGEPREVGPAMTDSPDTYEKFQRVPPHAAIAPCATSSSRSTCASPSSWPAASPIAASHPTICARSRSSGLLKAVERFEPDRGLQFSSFATPTITGELKRHFRDRGWAVRVPRRIQELHLELDRTVNDLSQELGRPPTPAEIAQRAGVLEEDVLESMEAGSLYRLASIDAGRPDDESSTSPAQRLGRARRRAARGRRPGGGQRDARRSCRSASRTSCTCASSRGSRSRRSRSAVGISQMHVSRLLARSLETLGEHASAVAEA